MKCIRKHGAPHEYRIWRARVRRTQDEDYRQLKNPVKGVLHRALLAEQGFICAYTMKRVFATDSHIEHIKPETRCRADQRGSDLDYENLVACFPRDGMERRYRYGAQQKDDWWAGAGAMFISPLHPTCEKSFRFGLDGNISAANGNQHALTTIQVLGLDHPSLSDDRKRVIDEFVYGPTGSDPLSAAQAQQALTGLFQRDATGCFHEFCVAIVHAVEDYREILVKNTRRRRFARRRN